MPQAALQTLLSCTSPYGLSGDCKHGSQEPKGWDPRGGTQGLRPKGWDPRAGDLGTWISERYSKAA